MFINEIISKEEVMESLVSDYEVLMIQKNRTIRGGIICLPLTGETFTSIKKFLSEEDPNRIYVKTEKYVKKEEKENEK